jgi:hypothetical protein
VLLALTDEPLLKSEEVLGAEEEPPVAARAPRQPEPVGELLLRRERRVAAGAGRADGRKIGRDRERLEEGGLARSVVAD